MNDQISLQEALIYIMVITSAADNSMTDKELFSIGEVVKSLPIFADFDADQIIRVAQDCGERLQAENGMVDVLDLIAATVPAKFRDTAYAIAVEIAAADLKVNQEELRMLQLLRDKLNLDKLTVAALERSALARFRAY